MELTPAFSVTGGIAGSLLAGNLHHNNRAIIIYIDNAFNFTDTDITHYRNDNNPLAVVPELDAHLGLIYRYPFSPGTTLGLELGYEVTNYFGAVNSSLQSFASTQPIRNDFALQGPYLRAELAIV